MKLTASNPFLRTTKDVDAALFVSARTSSAIEGIRKPFARASSIDRFTNFAAFETYWKARASAQKR